MNQPPVTEELMCVELYLKPQDSSDPDAILHCLFCSKASPVEWETHFRPEGTGKLIGSGVCESCRVKLKPIGPPPSPDGFVHVDDFIDGHDGDPYARFVLNYFRLNAICNLDFRPFMEKHRLFCTYKDTGGDGAAAGRYRVTGASRLGDIWLARDFVQETGYDYRVNVADCHEWSCQP